MRELMKEMSTAEIIGDLLHIVWYIAWRAAVVGLAFFGVLALANWSWWA